MVGGDRTAEIHWLKAKKYMKIKWICNRSKHFGDEEKKSQYSFQRGSDTNNVQIWVSWKLLFRVQHILFLKSKRREKKKRGGWLSQVFIKLLVQLCSNSVFIDKWRTWLAIGSSDSCSKISYKLLFSSFLIREIWQEFQDYKSDFFPPYMCNL